MNASLWHPDTPDVRLPPHERDKHYQETPGHVIPESVASLHVTLPTDFLQDVQPGLAVVVMVGACMLWEGRVDHTFAGGVRGLRPQEQIRDAIRAMVPHFSPAMTACRLDSAAAMRVCLAGGHPVIVGFYQPEPPQNMVGLVVGYDATCFDVLLPSGDHLRMPIAHLNNTDLCPDKWTLRRA